MKWPFVSRRRYEAAVKQFEDTLNKALDPKLLGLEIHRGMIDMGIQGGAAQLVAGMFVELLKQYPDAKNHMVIDFWTDEFGPITVTVQRNGGVTPVQRIEKLTSAVKEAAAKFREYEQIHMAKIPLNDGDFAKYQARMKAQANADMAAKLESLLT